MTKPKKDAPRFYWVVCEDWTLGPYDDRERAVRILEGVVGLGACSLPHSIYETTTPGRRPRARFARY